jgi:hypothetical protein
MKSPIYRFGKWLESLADKITSRYCWICGERLVLYKDGYWDCRNLVQEEKQRRGGQVTS